MNKSIEDLEDQLKVAEKTLKKKVTEIEDKEIEIEKYSTKA